MRKKRNYHFHPELKLYTKMNVPIIPWLLPIMQPVLRMLSLGERSGPFVKVRHGKIVAKDGHKIRTTTYVSRKFKKDGPCILVFHGGGFVYPASLHHYVLARKLAKELKAKAILVDYRLSPKHKFPAAVEDAFTAYRWVLANAGKLGIDRERIAVCGDSAGGNLSAVVSQWARDNGIQKPCGQVLIYPAVDGRMKTKSVKLFTDTPMCNTRAMEKYFRLYLPEGIQQIWECERQECISLGASEHKEFMKNTCRRINFSPTEAKSFKNLPPALIEVAQYDCLRDEGLQYAEKLRKAGVRAEVCKVKGAMHGYDIATGTRVVKKCMERRIQFLETVFEKQKAEDVDD